MFAWVVFCIIDSVDKPLLKRNFKVSTMRASTLFDKSFLRLFCWCSLLCFVFHFTPFVYSNEIDSPSEHLSSLSQDVQSFPSFHLNDPNSAVQVQQISHTNVRISDLGEQIERLPNHDLIVSTDSEAIVNQVIPAAQKQSSRLTKLIPIGRLVEKIQGRIAGAKNTSSNAYQHLVQSAKDDKVGLYIVIINTAYDSFIWLHATQYSTEVAVVQSLYSVFLAVAFSVDKDLWSRLAWKIQGKLIRLFDFGAGTVGENLPAMTRTQEFATAFLSHLTLSFGIQSVRFSICAFDQVISTPMLLGSAGIALAIASLNTFSSFAFSDFLASIDARKYPFAKTVFRRFQDIRTLIIGQIASSAKVTQPEIYGLAPHLALLATGAVGTVFYNYRQKITEWVEKIPQVASLPQVVQTTKSFFHQHMNKVSHLFGRGILRCENLLMPAS